MRAVLLAATTLAIVAAGAVMPAAGAQTPDAAPTPIAAPSGEDAGEPGTSDTGTDQNPGLLLAVLVPPVVLVALIWLAYIFRLIFTEPSGGGNGPGQPPDAGGKAPPADADETARPSAPPDSR